jgi:hypothetical protein
MAETLGSLCDKLTIVKLKQYHSEEKEKLASLSKQEVGLCDEINALFNDAFSGKINPENLTFSANKVYKKEGNEIPSVSGDIGEIFSELAQVNCDLWHEQEKVYEFELIPVGEKDKVVKQLALLNLKRNQCIDAINKRFQQIVIEKTGKNV